MKRAGRKRKVGIKRQPNGQPYRPPVDPREVATDARMRHYGFTKKRAREQWAGYEIGRMALRGVFGPPAEAQKALDAVEAYVKVTAEYMRLKCPQMPMPRAMDYLAGRGASLNGEPSKAKVDSIVEAYDAFNVTLSEASGIDRMYFHDTAFHDRICAHHRVISVKACVELLRGVDNHRKSPHSLRKKSKVPNCAPELSPSPTEATSQPGPSRRA